MLAPQYNVKMEAVLGEGGYATIYKARCTKEGALYAVKHLRLTADPDAIKEVQNEAKTMTKLQGHPNVLQLLAVAFAGPAGQETDGFLLLHYCPATLLDVMQHSNFWLPEPLILQVFRDVCHAVDGMHMGLNPPMAHRCDKTTARIWGHAPAAD